MLNNISWSEYLTFVAVSALIYYFFVLFTYYRKDLLRVSNVRRNAINDRLNFTYVPLKESQGQNPETSYQPKPADHMIESLMDEVRAYLKETGKNNLSKDILLECLGMIATKYPVLAQSEHRNDLDRFLLKEVEMNCAVSLSESEVRRIWSGA